MNERITSQTKKIEAKRDVSASNPQHADMTQSASSSLDQVLFLQRTIGNRAVGRLLKSRGLQAKLKISKPGDKYEQEADRVADSIMNMSGPHKIEQTANTQLPLLQYMNKVQADHVIQREVSTPLEDYVPKVEENKAAEFKVGDIDVVVEHDIPSKDEKMKNRAETAYNLDKHKTPPYKHKKNRVTEIMGPLPKFKIRIQTTYGPGVTAKSPSGYGKGTTQEDIKAGKTSLKYHEGSHGTDFLKYMKDNPPPKFGGKVGMKVSDYKEAEKKFTEDGQKYFDKMKKNSVNLTDCVGKKADFCTK